MNVDRFIKKKNILMLSAALVFFFLLYQLGFYMALTSETDIGNRIVPVLDHRIVKEVPHVRSEADKYISEHGVIKGVLGKHVLRYRPDDRSEFKCLNSEQHIPFERVNDDFCDCDDGTDEPSTNACPAGVFYCDTQYQKRPVILQTVPSSKVNDGICDCCDGSDEWLLQPNKKVLSQSTEQHYRYYVALCGNVC